LRDNDVIILSSYIFLCVNFIVNDLASQVEFSGSVTVHIE